MLEKNPVYEFGVFMSVWIDLVMTYRIGPWLEAVDGHGI